jgi:hypothetical protein
MGVYAVYEPYASVYVFVYEWYTAYTTINYCQKMTAFKSYHLDAVI